jgi:hypothetical protein
MGAGRRPGAADPFHCARKKILRTDVTHRPPAASSPARNAREDKERTDMRPIVASALGLACIANGLIMLAIPDVWYDLVPTVPATGPFNPHFVRDIGAAFLVSGATLTWFAITPAARPAAQVGAAFLTLHALVHLWDAAAGREHLHNLMLDTPSVIVPALLAGWIVWPRTAAGESSS